MPGPAPASKSRARPLESGPSAAAEEQAPPAAKRARAPPAPGAQLPVYDPSMRAAPLPPSPRAPKVLCWNVAGLRGMLSKNAAAVSALVEREAADVVALQEIKLQESHCDEARKQLGLPDWSVTWNCSRERKGYSGVAILSRQAPLSVACGMGTAVHDGEGRLVTAEFDRYYVVAVYVPNSGAGLKRLEYRVREWDAAFAAYLEGLQKNKPVIVVGDLNCAHREIDIHAPKTNLKSAGFTPRERESFERLFLSELRLKDGFREIHPGVVGYTYWGHRFNLRAQNKGWRLDYVLVSDALWSKVHDVFHLSDVQGSDHCPLGIQLNLDRA
ncbi:hypothetical protein H632_c33p2 [Helicosporidium sp. ATCC 50920]|nr:hypothetical protein H632_c33p2 [Helicosporidium sp. ATCC 50920]|eukprot:KDD77043.1 hypothetical protein H632_c33p2 [Helicosporidium sp. ATCC 50920]